MAAVEVLGIINTETLHEEQNYGLEKELINLLIELRSKAKSEKNYSFADMIRDKLQSLGISLKDTKDGTTYKIVEKWLSKWIYF